MNHVMTMVRARWIPSLFVLGFLVVVAVNAVLIVHAVGSFSGLVVEHPYRKGAEFTRNQQALVAQQALHWQYRLAAEPQPDGRIRLTLIWLDAAEKPLLGLQTRVELSRPVENLPPISVRLVEQGGGRYEALLPLPRAGLWDMRFMVTRGEHTFTAAERLLVP